LTHLKHILLITLSLITTVYSHGQVQLEPVCANSIQRYGVSGFEDSDYTWVVEGANTIDGNLIFAGDGTDSIEMHWGDKNGIFKIEVEERTAGGCKSTSSALVEVRSPMVNIGSDFEEICENDSMVFDARGNYAEPVDYYWQNNMQTPVFITDSAQLVWVRVIDGNGCESYDSVNLIVNELPLVNLGNDTVLCDPTSHFIPSVYDAGVLKYPNRYAFADWSRNNLYFANNTASYEVFPSDDNLIDTVVVLVTDTRNCIGTDSLLVIPCDLSGLFANIANSFTPDGNGQNDTWHIANSELFPNAVLEIFDRWGRLVYRTENVFTDDWDGKSKDKSMPMDAYYYVLKLNYGNTQPLTGTVNLIR
jgi:gliding motility-associated-like protein